jgi:hypothetical protein
MSKRKKIIFPILFLVLVLVGWPGAVKARGKDDVRNYLRVRVFENNKFVSGLGLADFELLENGQPQKLEGLLEINRKDIVKYTGSIAEELDINRAYFLIFQMYEYRPDLINALSNFFSKALTPGDFVRVQTPMGNYKLNPALLTSSSPEVAAKQMNDILKKDINQGNSFYQSLIRDLKRLVQGIEGLNPVAGGDEQTDASISYFGLERLLNQYRDSLYKLEALRIVDEDNLMNFASMLKSIKGQRVLYFIYQQEFRPEISPTMLNTLIDNNQDNQQVLSNLHDLFQVYHRELRIDQKKVIQAYCDSGVEVHFLFVEKVPEKLGGLTMREQSEDIFKLFCSISEATGGLVATGKNPQVMFERILEATENYYLLFYSPAVSERSGQFIKLTVRVKDPGYKVLNRAGYFN